MTRSELNALESNIKRMRYAIKVNAKANGETIVTLKNLANGNTFEGIATARASFPYADALKQANARMRQFEDRFAS